MSKFYPRSITRPDGANVVVNDHLQHSAHMGEPFGPDAQPLKKRPQPPSLEEVLGAGYSIAAAERIVKEERLKADQGIAPYGDRPREEFVPEPEPIHDAGAASLSASESATEEAPAKNKGGRPSKAALAARQAAAEQQAAPQQEE